MTIFCCSAHRMGWAVLLSVFSLFQVACSREPGQSPAASAESQQIQEARPNILWISLEDMGIQVGAYGDQDADTPNIDQLASEGLRYQYAYATAPVCAPSRSAIISGIYASSLGSQHMRSEAKLPQGVRIFPHYLRQAGYYTTNNSKTDYNFVHDQGSWDESSSTAHYRNRPQKDQPFFAVFNLMTTHESRVRDDDKYLEASKNVEMERRKKADELTLPPYYPDTPPIREAWRRYYDIITGADIQIGEIVDELEREGLAGDTIVVLWTDHGAGLPRAKRWVYDSGIRVPLVVFIPEKFRHLAAGAAGEVHSELVSLLDLAPTMLSLAGVDIPTHMQGRAFLGKNPSPKRDYIFAARDRMDERYDMVRAVHDGRYKYIRNYDPDKAYYQYMNTPERGVFMQEIRRMAELGRLPAAAQLYMGQSKPREELYDTHTDPHELNNLAASPEYQQTLKTLRQAHRQWRERTLDSGLLPEAHIRSLEEKYGKSIYHLLRDDKVAMDELFELADLQLSEDVDAADLLPRLSHRDPAVRYWVLRGLVSAELSDEALDQSLMPLLEDESPTVQIEAARLILQFRQDQKSVDVLLTQLQAQSPWLRLAAAQALEQSGEIAETAVEQIREALKDENKYVVRVANRHLNVMLGENNQVP